MRIVIFANGILEEPRAAAKRWVHPGDVIVGADGGTLYVVEAGLIPDHVIGDVDSLPLDLRQRLAEEGTRFHTYPPAKDETDLELALRWAAEQTSATEIVVLGALGGRPDQELANLLLLALPALKGHDVRLVGGGWEIRLIRSGETLTLHGQPGEIVSLVPLGGDAHGVTTSGLRYPLEDEVLHFGPARGISNVLENENATVIVDKGWLWCFHKRDRVA
ncbi:MAG: thiamine diphosphokinase [Anaerolineae bacterium]